MNKRNISYLLFALCFLIFAANFAKATSGTVAYIVDDSTFNDGKHQVIYSALDDLSLSHTTIKNSELSSTNFSQYSVVIVADDVSNRNLIPLENKTAIFFHKRIASLVWTTSSSGTQSGARNIKAVDLSSQMFDNVNIDGAGQIIVYTGAGGTINYLTPPIQSDVSVAAIIFTGTYRPTLAYSENLNGNHAVKSLFFGAPDFNLWSSNAKQIFKNGLVWALSDIDQDQDGYGFSLDCNDHDATINPGAEDIPYDSVDQNCDGVDNIDADGDGFCKVGSQISSNVLQCQFDAGALGTDCDDTNSVISPGSSDPTANCVNDAPTISAIDFQDLYYEGDSIRVEVHAADPENDSLFYSINSSNFVVNGNVLIWNTNSSDAGDYTFRVSVSDGQFSTTQEIAFTIEDVNRPPEFNTSFSQIELNEDSEIILNVNDLFHDAENDALSLSIDEVSTNSDVEVETIDSQNVKIISLNNFNGGAGSIVLSAMDGINIPTTIEININVLPLNDPVEFTRNISQINLLENGNSYSNLINLNDYFADTDSDLSFYVTGNQNVHVLIDESGNVSLIPQTDFYGVEQFVFHATDGEFTADSNLVLVNVTQVRESPRFLPLNCQEIILEDTDYNCSLAASDAENDTFEFFVANETNLQCEIDGENLIYKSSADYFGPASCQIGVRDSDGSSLTELNVIVENVNDAPKILLANPESENARALENTTKIFSIESFDSDSYPTTTWTLNGVKQKTERVKNSEFQLKNGKGSYLLEAVISDGEYSVTKSWNIIFGPTSDFTCSEVGGYTCSTSELCTNSLITVRDTNVCCSVRCSPKFSDAGSCSSFGSNVKVHILNLTSGQNDFVIGNKKTVQAEITNELDNLESYDVYFYLYNLDENVEVQSTSVSLDVDSDAARIARADLTIPYDSDENDRYAFFTRVEGTECNQDYLPIELSRPSNKLVISAIELRDTVFCGDSVQGTVTIQNIGTKDQDANYTVSNSQLELKSTGTVSLDAAEEEKDKSVREFSFIVPSTLTTGNYDVKADVTYNGRRETLTKKIRVTCDNPETQQYETVSRNAEKVYLSVNDETLQLSTLDSLQSASTVKSNTLIILSEVLIIDFLLLAAIALLRAADAKKTKKN